jgi:hypothetical protein
VTTDPHHCSSLSPSRRILLASRDAQRRLRGGGKHALVHLLATESVIVRAGGGEATANSASRHAERHVDLALTG